MTKPIDDMSCEELDKYFDEGGDVSSLFDAPDAAILRPSKAYEQRAVNTTLPVWIVDALDAEAARLCVSRRAVINTWLADRAEHEAERRKIA